MSMRENWEQVIGVVFNFTIVLAPGLFLAETILSGSLQHAIPEGFFDFFLIFPFFFLSFFLLFF